jgi:hypothetical protein
VNLHENMIGVILAKSRADVMLRLLTAGQLEFASKQLVAAVQANTGGMAGHSGLLLPLDQMASTFWSESSAGELAQHVQQQRTFAVWPALHARKTQQRQTRSAC